MPRKTFIAVLVSLVAAFSAVPAVAGAKDKLKCPPGTTNPHYCVKEKEKSKGKSDSKGTTNKDKGHGSTGGNSGKGKGKGGPTGTKGSQGKGHGKTGGNSGKGKGKGGPTGTKGTGKGKSKGHKKK